MGLFGTIKKQKTVTLEVDELQLGANIYRYIDNKFGKTEFSIIDESKDPLLIKYMFYTCCFMYCERACF